MNRKRLMQVVCLIVCFLMMSIAWLREGHLFGHDLIAPNQPEAPTDTLPTAPVALIAWRCRSLSRGLTAVLPAPRGRCLRRQRG